jgi:hypothetical protein
LALKAQYAGKDKWDAIIAKHKDIIARREWKGNSNFTLESFVQQHRTAYIQMTAAAEHVPHQLPDGYTRVTDLLSKIICDDAGLQAAIAHIENDDAPGGKRHNFEDAVAYLLPKDPVVKRQNTTGTNKRNNASISDVHAESSGATAKQGIGSSGVHLRYHTNKEYAKLTVEQRNELRDYRAKNPDEFKNPAKKQKKKDKRTKALAAAVEKAVNKHLESRGQATPTETSGNKQISAVEQQARNLLQMITGSASQGGNVSSVEVKDAQEESPSGPTQDAEEEAKAGSEVAQRETYERALRRAGPRRPVSHRYLR